MRVAVVEEGDLGVRCLTVIYVSEAAADAHSAVGQRILIERPAGDVHLMNTLIAQIAAAVVPEPVPIVVKLPTFDRPLRCGAEPEVVIHRGWGHLRSIDFSDAVARFVAEPSRQGHLAQFAGMNVFHRVPARLMRTRLRSCLADTIEFAGDLDGATPLRNIVADGLLDIDILAVLHGPDRCQRVPMVGSGDGDGVDLFHREQIANILYRFGPGLALLFDEVGRFWDDGSVGIAKRDDLDVVAAEVAPNVVHSAAMHTDDGDMDLIVGGDAAAGSTRGGGSLRNSQTGHCRQKRLL